MAVRLAPRRQLGLALRYVKPRQWQPARQFSISSRQQTDGVFRDLTNERVQVPWIEAFRKRQKEGDGPDKDEAQPATPADRDLSPKKMSDSYHSVVCIVIVTSGHQLTD